MDMEWKWSKANEKDLARFVNEKAIQLLDKLLVEDRLKLLQEDSGRRTLVKAIYETLITKDIRYDVEKYQTEAETQLIRTPAEILSTPGEGTCLDLALLFCSLCFGYGLLPLLIVIEGHAFAAVSLKHSREQWNDFARERTILNAQELFQGETKLTELQKWVEDEAYIAVECTGFAHTQSFSQAQVPEAKGRTTEGVLSFGRSVKAGSEQLENPDRTFKFAIDIAAAKYVWKIPTEEIPNFYKAQAKAKALFKVDAQDIVGGKVVGVKADKVTSGRDVEANVNVKNANKTEIYGGEFKEL